MTANSYLTLGEAATAEIKEQRSRFLALAAPAGDEAAAREQVAAMQRRYHDCRHVCSAWRLGREPRTVEVRNDAGEPAGTAGEPILAAIRRAGVTDTVVVVARYFGGVKLGTGGLARAYGAAAEAALAAAPVRKILLGRTFRVTFPYAQQKTLGHLLDRHGGRTLDEQYGAEVTWRLWLPHSRWRDFAAALREATADQIRLEPADK